MQLGLKEESNSWVLGLLPPNLQQDAQKWVKLKDSRMAI
jgi:hypothetical protein